MPDVERKSKKKKCEIRNFISNYQVKEEVKIFE